MPSCPSLTAMMRRGESQELCLCSDIAAGSMWVTWQISIKAPFAWRRFSHEARRRPGRCPLLGRGACCSACLLNSGIQAPFVRLNAPLLHLGRQYEAHAACAAMQLEAYANAGQSVLWCMQVALVLIDEVHLLNESRGASLEGGVISRIKMIGALPSMAEVLPRNALHKTLKRAFFTVAALAGTDIHILCCGQTLS